MIYVVRDSLGGFLLWVIDGRRQQRSRKTWEANTFIQVRDHVDVDYNGGG